MKKILLAGLLLVPMMSFAQGVIGGTQNGLGAGGYLPGATSTIVGGDRDAHGCIPSAGYTWSTTLNKCVRPWENNVNTTCINAALDKRENTLITAHDAFNAAIKTAIGARGTAMKDAWAQATKAEMKVKKEAAQKAFRTAGQSAHTNLRTARVSAWKAYDVDMKACGVKSHGESAQNISAPTSSL